MTTTLRFLGFGLIFGFILQKTGASNPTLIWDMFLLENLHLMGVIGIGMAAAGIGFAILKKSGVGAAAAITAKPSHRGNLAGGLLFGTGWALTGACPGTALAMVGEGRFAALFIVAGIFLGTMLHQRVGKSVMSRLEGSARTGTTAPAAGSSNAA